MELVKIGEAAAHYNISGRTLRYWEEKGIIKSTRHYNGYRYYDERNFRKIQNIVLLKKLNIKLSDIDIILSSDSVGKTVSILQKYQEDIKMEIHNLNTIKHIITMLIVTHRNFKDLSALLSASEKINAETNDVSQGFDNTFLSERNIKMKSKDVKQNVRIVNLPNMTFACYRAESETPENDCSNIIDNFAKEKKLHKISGFRHFGFNNPNPTEGNPVYGYEMWVSIPKDFEVPSPLWKHEFSGGLFASLPATLENIFERWMELGEFMENSEKYDIDYDESKDRICLEENTNCISVYENSLPETEMHFDLLVPIKRR